jgi:hypothetical protein
MTEFTYADPQRTDPRIAALYADINAAQAKDYHFGRALLLAFWSAEGNANDTVYVELARPEEDLPSIFWGTLREIMTYSDGDTPAAVKAWYAERGIHG